MTESVSLMGVVIYAAPVGEYDKRLVILTKERGKITVFARGARKPNSPFIATSNPFVFGTFTVYEGKNSYSLIQASVAHHFRELAAMQPQVYYGFYFLEFAEYYASENNMETDLVNLVFVALRALQKEQLSNELVRYIFEIRIMTINGEFGIDGGFEKDHSVMYTLKYIMTSPIQKLFSFTVSEEVLRQIKDVATRYRKQMVDREFRSLGILYAMLRV